MSTVFASMNCLHCQSNIVSIKFNNRCQSGHSLAVTKYCCSHDSRLLSSTLVATKSRDRQWARRLDKQSRFHRESNNRGCRLLAAPVAASGSPEDGKSGSSSWDIGRFAKTVLFFNSPPSINEAVSALVKAITSIFQPKDMGTTGGAVEDRKRDGLVMVVGATGGLGRRVVQALKKKGIPVRALVRDREKAVEILGNDVGLIKGNTPEAVDYRGMVNLLDAVGSKLGLRNGLPLLTISEKGIPSGPAWGALDDVVMGGVSKSNFQIDMTGGENGQPVALFKGEVVLDDEVKRSADLKFQNFETLPCLQNFEPVLDLSAYEGIMIRLKGNGKRFKFVIRTDSAWDTVSYPQSFDTQPGVWQTIVYSKFEYDGALNPAFEPGPFEIALESIQAYLKQPVTSRFVHVGSCGVTRPGRPDLEPEKVIPALRLNEALGGLLTYKLKGEDAVRASGIPYTIVRPVALTNEPGGAVLAVDQGDNIIGKISRNDVADLCIACLSEPAAVDKTFEVKSLVPVETPFEVDPSAPPPERDFAPLLATLVEGVTGKMEETVQMEVKAGV
ncbi:hypothetical protein CBR_g48496 [Chara braunii]|uniref:NAD(P)-binding domain-containing protein n=1 Tax=Chara braunii TaxID=69332 RepID=A0A388M2U5_CHABU|nr:hypothetical protein CBR_g48496 [Chara braunii]|eukprot:GBG88884.1 hypothetical protein CBR_g48496 [Chara braunii]